VTPTNEVQSAAPPPAPSQPPSGQEPGEQSQSPPKIVRPRELVRSPPEIGGRQGPDPTRYGDWELRGRCIDF
jgi:hypothetical protein